MDDEIQLISDGDGLAVIGDPTAVERFLASEGLASQAVALPKVSTILSASGGVAQAGSQVAANSGRWVKLTKESAQLIAEKRLRTDSKTGLSTGVINGAKTGRIGGFVKFTKPPSTVAANPALLAGAAGIMAQLAMQQTMKELTDYLATIDEKVDDLLRAQKDEVVAGMIGVGLDIDEAMVIREHGGGVNEVTWSKVQASSSTVARTQAYALLRLDALADKLESRSTIRGLAETAEKIEADVQGWLAVLARCFQLHDALAILEIDRVAQASPEGLDGHRRGLRAARQKRLDSITASTHGLLARMEAAAAKANTKVLFHPAASPTVVRSTGRVAEVVSDLHGRLGIEGAGEPLEARPWSDAAADVKDKVLEVGSDGFDASKRLGGEALVRARAAKDKVSRKVSEHGRRKGGATEDETDSDERG